MDEVKKHLIPDISNIVGDYVGTLESFIRNEQKGLESPNGKVVMCHCGSYIKSNYYHQHACTLLHAQHKHALENLLMNKSCFTDYLFYPNFPHKRWSNNYRNTHLEVLD
jgi:histidinol phosphatase-like enzyme